MGFFKTLGKIAIGAAAVGVGGVGGGIAYASILSQRKAEKQGRRAADAQNAAYAEERGRVQSEQTAMNQRLAKQQQLVNAGIARSSRSRAKGGIFGDSSGSTAQGTTRPTLG